MYKKNILHVNVYFTDLNIIQRRGAHGIVFWRSWHTEMKYTNRVQKVDEENRVISLVVILAPTLTVLKMPKSHFYTFCWLQQNGHNLGKIFKCTWNAPGVNMITDRCPIFLLYSLSSICWYISLCISRTLKLRF